MLQPSTSKNSAATMTTTGSNKSDMLCEGLHEKSIVDLHHRAINAAILSLLSEISQLKQKMRDLRQSDVDLTRCVTNALNKNFGINEGVADLVQQRCLADINNSSIKTKERMSSPLVPDISRSGEAPKLNKASTNK